MLLLLQKKSVQKLERRAKNSFGIYGGADVASAPLFLAKSSFKPLISLFAGMRLAVLCCRH